MSQVIQKKRNLNIFGDEAHEGGRDYEEKIMASILIIWIANSPDLLLEIRRARCPPRSDRAGRNELLSFVRYTFATHAHMDHVEGVPQIQEQFPDAQLCYNKKDYEDFLISTDWIEESFPEDVAEMKKSPEFKKWFEYDMTIFKEPDIYLEDNQTYKLGNLEVRTFLSPGHSAGSICFHVGDVLFSGDVLFHRQVGRTDLLGGSKENIVKSVQRLYAELPDATKVYPGHGEFTEIGTEKIENEEVREDAESVKN